MKYFKSIFTFIFLWSFFHTYAEMVYPIQTMSKINCRFENYQSLWDECKMSLPILKTSDYIKYKNDYSLYRRVYTILWWSSYDYWWDVWNWWHEWVDIATAKWTPVYSITDWKVILASNIIWWWNTVKIEHTINGRKVYSNYSHLSKIDVSIWDTVKTKTKLWEVWSTWNSTGNHLHFQIDLSISWKWPRYRSNCSEKNYNKIVNSNICFEQLNINTIDPLLFLETAGAIVKKNEIDKPKQANISQKWLLSREEILKREIQDFLKTYEVKVNIINLWGNIELSKNGTFRISVIDKRTKKPFTGSFPWDMNFKYDGKKISIFPTGILQIDNGNRDFQVIPKTDGKMNIDIYLWETFFKKLDFWVIDTKKTIIPHSWVFISEKESVIWNNSQWLFYFKNNYWLNILWFPFDGNYTLSSENKTVKFCLKKANSFKEFNYMYHSKCDERLFVDEITFSYKDTLAWILVFDYKALNIWINTLLIKKPEKIFGQKKILSITPKWWDINNAYYDDIIKLSQLWITSGMKKWYFLPERELSSFDGVNFIYWSLQYKLSKCLDENCKNKYIQKINTLSKLKTDKYEYLTRWEFIKLIGDNYPLNEYTWNDFMVFRDIKEDLKIYVKSILKNKTWNDYFGKTKYFQPDKKITRWEWAFLIHNILK